MAKDNPSVCCPHCGKSFTPEAFPGANDLQAGTWHISPDATVVVYPRFTVTPARREDPGG